MARSQPNSFDRVFGGVDAAQADETEGPPSVHALFVAVMRDELSLPEFADALDSLHGIPMTAAAVRLMTSPDAKTGQLSFSALSRALQAGDLPGVGAGAPMVIGDQAGSIIQDNSGAPVPKKLPSQMIGGTGRPSTDICQDPFIKQEVRLQRAAAKTGAGQLPGNPVVQTNHVSAGNPLQHQRQFHDQGARPEDAYEPREMANTATRMYVGGEIERADYESFLVKSGIRIGGDCELTRLITKHEKVGDGNFSKFMRAVNLELSTDYS